MHIACCEGNSETILRIVEHLGQDTLNDLGESNWSPLHYACNGGKIENVKTIIGLYKEKGLSLNPRDDFKQTPLFQASKKGHSEVVKLLLTNDASFWPNNR